MVLRAGFHGTVGQPSAQVIDGSLKFDSSKENHLEKDISSDGNRKTWTWSSWVKKSSDEGFSEDGVLFEARTDSPGSTDANIFGIRWRSNGRIGVYDTGNFYISGTREFRDTSAFYHLVLSVDTTQASNNISLYVNGDLYSQGSYTQNSDTRVNSSAATHRIGARTTLGSQDGLFLSSQLSQCYFIDGLALGPENFGFTDPLTNTWRPKKYTGDFSYTLTAPTYDSSGGSDVTTTEFAKMVDGDLSTYGQANGAAGTNRFIGFSLAATEYPTINIKIKNTTGGALDFFIQPDEGSGYTNGGTFASSGGNSVNVAGGATHEDTYSFPSNYSGTGRIYLNNSGNAADAWEIYDFGGTKVTTNSFYLPMDGNSLISQDKSGNGNDFTPINFNGSNSVDKATGALPILEGAGGAVANVSVRTDANASNLVLALPLVGSANDVSNRINSGSTTKAATVSGASADSLDSNFYGGSFVFDGSNDQLNYGQSADFNFGGGDWTIETWVNMDTISAGQALLEYGGQSSSSAPYGQWYFSTSNGWHWFHSSSSYAIIPKADLPLNKWIHLALVRNGDVLTHYLNGVAKASSAYTRTDAGSSSNDLIIGQQNSSSWFDGHVQDYRVYKGVAKYTSNFVPASTNPDILPDTPSGVSGGSKLTKITDGAVSFDGTDYLTVADGSNDFSFGTGAYTVEGYLYPQTLTGNGDANPRFFCCGTPTTSTNRNQLQIVMTATGQIRLDTNGTTYTSTAGDVVVNKWQHIAVARDGSGNLKAFVDGRQVLSQTSVNNDITNNDGISLGIEAGASSRFTGFMSNVRILKGTALYTSAFTPPERTLTNITNTKLLCCQSNTLAGSATVAPTISGLNDGRVWSSGSTTGTVYASDNNWNNVFNGVAGNNKAIAANDATYEITLPGGGISGVTKVEIYGQQQSGAANATITLSSAGEQSVAQGTSLGYTTFYTGSSDTLTKLKVASTSSNRSSINAVRINDTTILTDPLANSVGASPDAAATTFNPFNTDINTVRGQETGYATLNPLDNTGITKLVNGNLDFRRSVNDGRINSTIAASSGKWYAECQVGNDTLVGVSEVSSQTNTYPGGNAGSYGYFQGGFFYDAGSGGAYAAAFTTDDYIGCILDLDNGTIAYTKNGVSQGVAKTGLPAGSYRFSSRGGRHDGTETLDRWNFGQKPFKFPPPDGFQPLNAANFRPETVITRPDQHVGIVTYTGDAPTAQQITGLNFGTNPDFVWVKNYSDATGYHHGLFDTVRGANKVLASSDNAAEATTTQQLMSFDHNGFTVGTNTDSQNYVNLDADGYVAWCWRAGGDKGTFNVDDVSYASASDINMSASSLNSAVYNTSNRWSDDYAGAAVSSGYEITKAFDGNRTTTARVEATQTAMSVALTNITVTNKIEVRGELGFITPYVEVTVGGTTHQIGGDPDTLISGSAGTTSRIITGVSGALTNVKVGRVNSGRTYLSQIIVDGKILVDDNITPPNAPSIPTTSCSVGTRQGFSILKYTGSGSNGSIAHGLSQAPDFFFGRDLEDTGGSRDWIIYHKSIGGTGRLKFNQNGTSSASAFFQDTSPTNSLIMVGTSNDINSTNDYILYCWHNVPGLQKFGSYGGEDAFVELGFRPALLIIKSLSGSRNWILIDTARDTFNPSDRALLVNDSAKEDDNSVYAIDFLSNGFKIRGSNGQIDGDSSYIYAAWAEAPAINLYGGQSNAR